MAKYLTLEGLEHYHTGLKGKFTAQESGKGLSANDLTAALKVNYDTAYTHSQSAHAPSNAQANVLDTIKRNGVALTPSSKSVDISVPTKVSDLTNDSSFITKTVGDLVNYFTKTEVNALISGISTLNIVVVSSLPTSNISTTTIYLKSKSTTTTDNIYDEYIYVSGKWEKIGDTAIDLSGYSQTNHTHNYAGASSAGGVANAATKLNTTRALKIGDASKNFDGTAALTWTLAEIGVDTITNSEIDAIIAG